ncbi:hypothetical protein [Nocardioides alcanivorans]|uniref:hypothetical protein n=1 Tax=Nocardioides alcanivorans TaxID=2897352 RepID=UPI001F23AB10|nr:hypothetical protein [Nocardioides alcanivorans]
MAETEVEHSERSSDPTDRPGGPSRGRAAAALICLLLAAVLTTPAAVAYWGQRTLNDTQRYVATVHPLVKSQEVQEAITTVVTDAIEQQVDVEGMLNDLFARVVRDPARLDLLVGPLSAAVSSLIEREVRDVVSSDEFAEFWVRVNTRAQQALKRVLTGDESGLATLEDGQVVLSLDELIERVKERIADRGLTLVQNVPVPRTERQLVLMEASQVEQLRTIYAFGNPVAQWLLPFTGLLFAVAFVLARRRARMTVAIGAALALNALMVALALSVGRQLFVNASAGTAFGPASRTFFDTLLAYLTRGQEAVLWLGVVLIVAGWFAGTNATGTTCRVTLARGLGHVGEQLPRSAVGTLARWCAANAGWLRPAVVVLGLVVLVWGNAVTTERLWWCLALVVALLAGLQVLIGAGRPAAAAPAPPGSPASPGARPDPAGR